MTSYPRRVANIERARALGRRWRMTTSYVTSVLFLTASIAVVGHWLPTLPSQLLVGVVLGGCGMALALGVARFDDWRVKGMMAEQFTADTFKRQRKWSVVHNVSFEDGDVDSVVITPAGVIAVETKWRHDRHEAAADLQRQSDLVVARKRADKIRRFLCISHKIDVEVMPMLIVWGSGAPTLPIGYRVTYGVWEVDGNHPELWAPSFARGPVTRDLTTTIIGALSDYQKSRAAFARKTTVPLRSEMWSAFKEGRRTERAERQVRRQAQRAMAHGHTVSVEST